MRDGESGLKKHSIISEFKTNRIDLPREVWPDQFKKIIVGIEMMITFPEDIMLSGLHVVASNVARRVYCTNGSGSPYS